MSCNIAYNPFLGRGGGGGGAETGKKGYLRRWVVRVLCLVRVYEVAQIGRFKGVERLIELASVVCSQVHGKRLSGNMFVLAY